MASWDYLTTNPHLAEYVAEVKDVVRAEERERCAKIVKMAADEYPGCGCPCCAMGESILRDVTEEITK